MLNSLLSLSFARNRFRIDGYVLNMREQAVKSSIALAEEIQQSRYKRKVAVFLEYKPQVSRYWDATRGITFFPGKGASFASKMYRRKFASVPSGHIKLAATTPLSLSL